MDERKIWESSPSQVMNWSTYGMCILVGFLVIGSAPGFIIFPIVYAGWKWYELNQTRYELTSERFFYKSGLMTKEERSVELYRIKEFLIEQPWYLKIFNLSHITLCTSNPLDLNVELYGIHNAEALRDEIRKYAELARDKKRVREIDFENWDMKN